MKKVLSLLLVLIVSSTLLSCSKQNESPTASPQTSGSSQSEFGPKFTNAQGNALRLGMDSAAVQKIFKKPCPDGWYTAYDKSIVVLNIDGRVKALTFSNNSWKTPEGITVGASQKDIRTTYGEPTDVREYNPKLKALGAMDSFDLKDGGTGYTMQFTYDENNVVKGILVSTLTPDMAKKVQGNITLQESGTGNAVLKDLKMNLGVFDITHDGTGTFKVRAFDDKGNEKIMVNTTGRYSGRLCIPDFNPYSLDITADGNWTVTALFKSGSSLGTAFSGNGDFVSDNLNVSTILSKWKITYDGEGPFVVKLHVLKNTETLLDVSGAYSGTVTSSFLTTGALKSDNTSYSGTLEILGSGSWKVEAIDPNDIQPSPRAAGTAPSEIAPALTNVYTGEKLGLGTDAATVTTMFGEPLEDGWTTPYDDAVELLSADGKLTRLNFYTSPKWQTAGGFAIGSARSDVIAYYGDPARIQKYDPKSSDTTETYDLNYGGNSYQLQFCYTGEKVSAIILDTGNASDKYVGMIWYQKHGTGNAVLSNLNHIQQTLELNNSGSGPFKVRAFDDKGNEKILVNVNGKYSGKLMIPDFRPFQLEITSDGDWSVVSESPRNVQAASKYPALTGTGDAVTDTIGLNKDNCKWQIDYNGEGPFTVILHTGNKQETLVNSNGKYSGTVSSDLFANGTLGENGGYMATFEVLSSGDWKIEMAK